MMNWKWWVGLAAVSAIVLSPAMVAYAQDAGADKPKAKADKPKADKGAKKDALKGEYGIMASVLQLTDEQKAKLKDALEAEKKAVEEWNTSADGRKLADLEKAAKEARTAGNKEESKKLAEQIKPLAAARRKLQAEKQAAVLAILTAEQKIQWESFKLNRQLMGRYKKLNLTQDQEKQVKELCDAAAKEVAGATDRKAQSAVTKRLQADVEAKVLTDAQREELKKAAQPKAPKEGTPKEGKAKEGKAKTE